MIEIKNGGFKVVPNGTKTELTLKEANALLDSYYEIELLGGLK